MSYFTDKVAVITGAASGLGKAIACELAGKGCRLALLDIDADGLQRVKAELGDAACSIHTVDISDESQVLAVVGDVRERYGKVDILINNAAISVSQQFDVMTLADYRRLMEVNFWGTVYCTKYFLPLLLQSSDSRLVNVISEFAYLGFPGKTGYASSKGAIMAFTNSLRAELRGSSVKVSLVIPPPMDTGLVKNGKHTDDIKKSTEEEFLRKNGMAVTRAAQKTVSGISVGKYRIILGGVMHVMDAGVRLFPTIAAAFIGRNKDKFGFV